MLRNIGPVAGWRRHNELDSVLGEATVVGDSSIGECDRASALLFSFSRLCSMVNSYSLNFKAHCGKDH